MTYEEAEKLFIYDPDTGTLRWRVAKSRRVRPGTQAGHMNDAGHVTVRVNGKTYPAGHIAMLLMTSKLPTGLIITKNRNPSDIRFENLKKVPK